MKLRLHDSESVPVLAGFLGAVGLISALLLVLFSQLTSGPIQKAKEEALKHSLKLLSLPAFDNAPEKEIIRKRTLSGFPVEFMPVRQKGKLAGMAAKVTHPHGYGGAIELLIGFSPEGKILAVLVTSQKETPGLGANICERKFHRSVSNLFSPVPAGLPPNPILDQFKGKSVDDPAKWKVKKEGGTFEFKTGATVTSKAIVAAVAETGALYRKCFGKGEIK